MKTSWLSLCIALAAVTSCGSDETPVEKKPNSETPLTDSCTTTTDDIKGLVTSRGKNWSAVYKWFAGPQTAREENFESRLELDFRTYDNKTPSTLKDLEFSAWIPAEGHGTGGISPVVNRTQGAKAVVNNLYFSNTGLWELTIKANVDGTSDEARFCVNVKY